jgi:hypothetical protein
MAGGAGQFNWMREHVKLREQAVLESAIGIERAAAIRSRATARIVCGQDSQARANPFQVALLDPALFPFTNEGQYCGGTLYSRGEFSTRSQSALVPLKLLRSTGPATPCTRPVVVNCQNAQSRARYFASGFAATERSQK